MHKHKSVQSISISLSLHKFHSDYRRPFQSLLSKDQQFLSHVLHSLCFSPLRLQSGVNLQVCFVNDSSSDKDSDAEDSRTETSLDTPLSPVVGPAQLVSGSAYDLFVGFCLVPLLSSLFVIITRENHIGCYIIVSLHLQSKQSSSLSDRDTAEEDSDPLDDCGGFWRVQRRLQEEARVALALARPMARMQVEVERQIQLHRRSPVADLVSQ